MGMDPVSLALIGGSLGLIGGKVLGGAAGGAKKAAAPAAAAPADTAANGDTAEVQARKRILAMNSQQGQLTAAGGDQSTATVSRKTLLGQ